MQNATTVPTTKNVIIEGGSFTASGNYSGYDSETAERYFIPGRLMQSKGWKTNEDVPTVFFAVLTDKVYNEVQKNPDGSNKLDEKGQPIPVTDEDGNIKTFTRATITKVYKTKEEHGDAVEAKATYHGYLEQRAAQAKASISVVSTAKANAVANAPV